MTIRALGMVICLLVFAAGSARATEIETWCRSEFPNPLEVNRCVQQNQAAKEKLDNSRTPYDPDTIRYCQEISPAPQWEEQWYCVRDQEADHNRVRVLRKAVGEAVYQDCREAAEPGNWMDVLACMEDEGPPVGQ